MDCCDGKKYETSEVEKKEKQNCTRCGSKSKKISIMTVRYMLKGAFQTQAQDEVSYRFCFSPTCPVVYFSEDDHSIFTKDQLSERVTIKESDDPIPICYCFNFFRHDVEKEIDETGKTTIPDFIAAQVKAKNCFCEYTNPQGTCCLGNVSAVVKTILKKEVPL